MAVAFAIISRDNSRLFTSICEKEAAKEYDVQLFIHCTLDIVEDKQGKATELYLGLLSSDQKYKSFGFVSNTGVRFVLVLSLANTTLKDQNIRQIFKTFHHHYTNALSNPFYEFGQPLLSRGLDDAATELFRSTPNE